MGCQPQDLGIREFVEPRRGDVSVAPPGLGAVCARGRPLGLPPQATLTRPSGAKRTGWIATERGVAARRASSDSEDVRARRAPVGGNVIRSVFGSPFGRPRDDGPEPK